MWVGAHSTRPARHRQSRARSPDKAGVGCGSGGPGGRLSTHFSRSVRDKGFLTVPTHWPERHPLHPLNPPAGRKVSATWFVKLVEAVAIRAFCSKAVEGTIGSTQ